MVIGVNDMAFGCTLCHFDAQLHFAMTFDMRGEWCHRSMQLNVSKRETKKEEFDVIEHCSYATLQRFLGFQLR